MGFLELLRPVSGKVTGRRIAVALGIALVLVGTVMVAGLPALARRSGADAGMPLLVGGVRAELVGHSATCGSARTNRLDYRWPVRPFDVQHPIRGNFGDPRTVSLEPFGVDGEDAPGAYSFHNGVDISAAPGTPVYPVVSGVADLRRVDEVIVRVGGRDFQYWHIRPAVSSGERVVAGKTMLGRVLRPADHVHLSEIDWGRVTNPALHLRPYSDHTSPVIDAIHVRAVSGDGLPIGLLSGRVQITVQAADSPSQPTAGAWAGEPVVPALLRWTLSAVDGRQVAGRVVVDFRRGEPAKQHFWDVYAAGTYQNFPVFDQHFYWRQPGRYLFQLTSRPLDTNRFANGAYILRVVASDLCGNSGTLTRDEQVTNSLAANRLVSPGDMPAKFADKARPGTRPPGKRTAAATLSTLKKRQPGVVGVEKFLAC